MNQEEMPVELKKETTATELKQVTELKLARKRSLES
jgi:hypothetical protein